MRSFTDIVKKMLDPLKSETYSRSMFHPFMRAFRSVVNCNLSAETLRSLSLFITYAIQESRRSSKILSRNTSVRTRQQTIHRLQRLSVSSSSSSLRSEHVDLKDNLSRAEVGIHILEMYQDILCEDRGSTNIQKFARTVTNKVCRALLQIHSFKLTSCSGYCTYSQKTILALLCLVSRFWPAYLLSTARLM